MAASDIRAGGAYIEVFTKDVSLQRGLQAASKHVQGFAKGVRAIGDGIAGLGKKIMTLGALITAPIIAASKSWADAGAELVHMSERTGMSVEALSALKYAASRTGVEFESIEVGIRRMQKLLVGAAEGSKAAEETLTRLGLSLGDLAGMTPDQQFRTFAEAFSQIHDPTVRAGLAMEVFGKKGTALIPLLARGAAGLDRFREEAEATGRIMSRENAEAALKLSLALKNLWGVATSLKNAFASVVAPVLTGFAEGLKNGVQTIREWVKGHQELVRNVFMGAAGMLGFGAALFVAGKGIGLVAGLMSRVSGAIGVLASGVGLVGRVLGTGLSVGTSLAGLGLKAFGGAAQGAWWVLSGLAGATSLAGSALSVIVVGALSAATTAFSVGARAAMLFGQGIATAVPLVYSAMTRVAAVIDTAMWPIDSGAPAKSAKRSPTPPRPAPRKKRTTKRR